ncbi:hypothetical protein Pcinc_040485 [Petrolisthes cinctipes]|uniref:Uncharacterized protein n=1 Tax=Petrolisthes cinctipes TaxID=88211 RepID=A0AAE1BM59_PETCI|nr:hypothetical protein Pcinc_040485 [Petrolisthes cinctipes]
MIILQSKHSPSTTKSLYSEGPHARFHLILPLTVHPPATCPPTWPPCHPCLNPLAHSSAHLFNHQPASQSVSQIIRPATQQHIIPPTRPPFSIPANPLEDQLPAHPANLPPTHQPSQPPIHQTTHHPLISPPSKSIGSASLSANLQSNYPTTNLTAHLPA